MAATSAPLDIIVGSKLVTAEGLEWVEGGMIAQLSGMAFLSVLDATFGGSATVELCGAGRAPQAMTVTEIAMQGASTYVTFAVTGAVRLN